MLDLAFVGPIVAAEPFGVAFGSFITLLNYSLLL